MSYIAGNTDPVVFDHDAAARLAARFRSTARELQDQISYRRSIEGEAAAEWRGKFAEKFAERMNLCVQDADRFATSMLLAANQLDELSRLAREEQVRRDKAVEWAEHERNESGAEKFFDFILNRDDRPPVSDPGEPPRFTIQAPSSAGQRG